MIHIMDRKDDLRESKWSMCVDTSEGFVTIFCKAPTRGEAIKKFRTETRKESFKKKYGNLFAFKENSVHVL